MKRLIKWFWIEKKDGNLITQNGRWDLIKIKSFEELQNEMRAIEEQMKLIKTRIVFALFVVTIIISAMIVLLIAENL